MIWRNHRYSVTFYLSNACFTRISSDGAYAVTWAKVSARFKNANGLFSYRFIGYPNFEVEASVIVGNPKILGLVENAID